MKKGVLCFLFLCVFSLLYAKDDYDIAYDFCLGGGRYLVNSNTNYGLFSGSFSYKPARWNGSSSVYMGPSLEFQASLTGSQLLDVVHDAIKHDQSYDPGYTDYGIWFMPGWFVSASSKLAFQIGVGVLMYSYFIEPGKSEKLGFFPASSFKTTLRLSKRETFVKKGCGVMLIARVGLDDTKTYKIAISPRVELGIAIGGGMFRGLPNY